MDIKPRKPQPEFGIARRQIRQPIGDISRPHQSRPVDNLQTTPAPEPELKQQPKSTDPFVFDTSDIDETQETSTKPSLPSSKIRNLLGLGSIRQFFRRLRLLIGLALVIGLGYIGFRAFLTVQDIIDRNGGGALALRDNIDPSELKGEGDGRVNILLIGIGGEEHQGGDLADTIMVASIDPFNYEVAMLSVPRDLWVPIPGQWTTKINAAHALGEESEFSEPGYPSGGPGLLQKTVEEVLGIPVHYYVRVDFEGFKQAVDAVGTINVDVPEAICDYNIAWQFGFACINAGPHEFDSDEALFYARTRASARGDFDRGERQRLLVLALRDKVLSLGTFANPIKVLDLLSAAGGHVRTNIADTGDIKRLYDIGEQIDPNNIISAGIDDYVTTGEVNGASAVLAKDPDFSDIQRYVRSIFTDGFIKKEAAVIDVLNGSGVPGLASQLLDELESYGYVIGIADNAPSTDYTTTSLYDRSGGSAPFTKRLLEQRLGVSAQNGNRLPEDITTSAKFVIIVGADAAD